MLRAKQIMTDNPVFVKKDTPIYEAVELLVQHNISGMPVVEGDMTLVGVISEKDVIKLFYRLKEDEEKTVADFMTQPPTHFDQEERLPYICDFLMKNIYRRVPITSEGKLVGIISAKDILETVLQSRRESLNIGSIS